MLFSGILSQVKNKIIYAEMVFRLLFIEDVERIELNLAAGHGKVG